ncbi:MAG: hypothetical protein EP299_06515, partial [Acidobacteria bacterium]
REQAKRPFRSVDDLTRRCRLRREELDVLAEVGALGSLGLTRRAALWQAAQAARPAGEMFEEDGLDPAPHPEGLWAWGRDAPPPSQDLETSGPGRVVGPSPQALKPPSPLPEMSSYDETLADYAGTGLTVGPHPLEHLRPSLDRQQIVPAAQLGACAHGQRVRTAGSVTVRQRPGTAKGLLFLTLEDETGMSQALVTPWSPPICCRPTDSSSSAPPVWWWRGSCRRRTAPCRSRRSAFGG